MILIFTKIALVIGLLAMIAAGIAVEKAGHEQKEEDSKTN